MFTICSCEIWNSNTYVCFIHKTHGDLDAKCPLWLLIFSTLDDKKFQVHLVPVTLFNGPSSLLQLALPLVWPVLSVETCLFIWSLQLWSNYPSVCRFYTVLRSLNHVCVLKHHGCVYTMCVHPLQSPRRWTVSCRYSLGFSSSYIIYIKVESEIVIIFRCPYILRGRNDNFYRPTYSKLV